MNNLDKKIKEIFSEASVYKSPQRYGIFSGKNLPSFIKDWLIKKFTDDENGEIDKSGLLTFMKDHIPSKDSKLKGKLLNDKMPITIFARLIVEPDVKKGIFRFSIPDLGIKFNEGRVSEYIVKKSPELKGGEVWGIATLEYIPPEGKERGFISIAEYKSFKPYDIELPYFTSARREYSFEEWVDLLIRSMEYNPDGFTGLTQKLMFISRLLVFVEPRLNLIELAPKGTGKSYVFGNLSKYCWIISGGIVTRAKLFYDIAKNTMGIITKYDIVAMDEIQTIKFSDEMELAGALKTYLESGAFTVAKVRQTSNASFILLGNIPLNSSLEPLDRRYFSRLPTFFQQSALLDRFHGFIEGWRLPRMNENLKLRGYTLNVEYFSEILHALREESVYASIIDELLEIPKKADTRDVTAIKRLTTGYLKLLFPNVRSVNDVKIEDFNRFCLQPALEKRGVVRKQINMIDSEFKEDLPLISVRKIV